MELFPAIDLRDGKAVRLVQGDYNQMTVFSDRPEEVALGFKEQGAKNLHVVDLDGAKAVGVDAKDGFVATHGWLETSEVRGVDFCRRLRDTGVKTVIYTDISRDGKMQGTNLELYKELSQIEGLDIVASGGISSLKEIEILKNEVYGAILGKALYLGAIDLKEALKYSV